MIVSNNKTKSTIMATIDFEFRNQIIQSDIGNTLAYCYQCATCSGACPVAQITNGRYNPRRLILDALLGLKEKIFGKENAFNIWDAQFVIPAMKFVLKKWNSQKFLPF